MRKAAKILSFISLVSAGSILLSLWSAQEPSGKEHVRGPEPPAAAQASQEVVRVTAATSIGQAGPKDPQAGAASGAPLDNEVASGQPSRVSLRSFLATNNPDLAEALGLTKEEAAAVLDLVADGLVRGFAANSADELSAEERRRARLEARVGQESDLKALLGEQKYKDWEVYQQGSVRRQQVANLRAQLLGGQAPLSDEQSRALIAAVSEENVRLNGRRYSAEATPGIANGSVGNRTPDLNEIEQSQLRLLDAARTILSSSQLAAYEEGLSAELALRRQLESFQ